MPAIDTQPAVEQPPAWSSFTGHQNGHPLRAELFGLEHLEAHARKLGTLMRSVKVEAGQPLLRKFTKNVVVLREAHRVISTAYREQEPLGHDAEWLLDNYYIISDTLAEIRTDLPRGYYARLPKLTVGPLTGYPRVYALTLDLVAHCDSSLDEANLTAFVQAFQAGASLTVGELWAIPIMLRLCLVENLRRLAEHIVQFRAHRCRAKGWIAEHLPTLKDRQVAEAFALHEVPGDWRDCYVVHLLEELHDHEAIHPAGVEQLEKSLAPSNDSTAEILRREKQRQAANQVSIGNCVTSLRLLSALDWSKFFENISHLEKALREDPAGVYAQQDFTTRDRYRQVVEKLAWQAKKDELAVARLLLETARKASSQDSPSLRSHIGYYLVDEGRTEFENAVGYRSSPGDWPRRCLRAAPNACFFGGLAVITVGLLALLAWTLEYLEAQGWLIALALIVALLPASELAVGWMNLLVFWLVPPRRLPRLDFKDGVPADCATFIVIPSMLTSKDGAANLVERLEIHYLSNPEKNVYFGLLTDFADAPAEHMPDDDAFLEIARTGIQALNAKYAGEAKRFFLLQRRRLWNPSQGCWMGWERKRGKLGEFNRLLRQAKDTSFSFVSAGLEALPHIRFVITLDTDTQLPRETARRLIATLAHPLNQPVFDPRRRRVVRGYGVLQPRVSLSLRGGRKSIFAQLFTGSAGVDPYATAVSDTYQDLFGSGSFTGKGIYDLDAFEATTGQTFPPNHILSHDLIEGNYARCGLASDVEVLDDYPSHYLAFIRREHRWVRGDWQIMPWLFGSVPDGTGKRVANPLPRVERWKILDNLRRSLVPAALIGVLVLGWTLLPGSPWLWTGLVALLLGWPLVWQSLCLPVRMAQQWLKGQQAPISGRDLLYTAGQVGLAACFLVQQAYTLLDAIGRTLYRLLITQRTLLEWETSAATEGRLTLSFRSFFHLMWPAPLCAALATLLLWWVRPEALYAASPFLLGWFFSPWIAYVVSQRRKTHIAELTAHEKRELYQLSRKTWTFFETFVGEQDHWLPPDNYQEDPKGEVAHRTSPTNIGLYLLSCLAAHDFGYLSLPALLDRLEKTFATLKSMEHSHGHLYNWYDTLTLKPLPPMYLSTVDSGNFAACLLALKQGLLEKIEAPLLGPALARGLRITLTLVEKNVHFLEAPGKGPHQDTWDALEPPLKALSALVHHAPEDGQQLPDWFAQLTKETRAVEEQLNRLAELLGEPVTELQRWVQIFAELVDERQEEFAGVLTCVHDTKQMPPLDQLTPAHLAGETFTANHQANGAPRQEWAKDLVQRCQSLAGAADACAAGMDFKVLYNKDRNLFAVGYNLSAGRLDNSHYDLLASEASLTSFLAVARGDVPKKHWFQLGRPMTRVAGNKVLLSWSGTMFEYLMPRLLLRIDPDTLLDESEAGAIKGQIDYGRHCGAPWGISESAFSTVDGQLNYQYQAFGVPGLGLKRGLSKDLVIAPYATGLAFTTLPRPALQNLHALRKEGAEGAYGWYEAIDYTAERLPKGKRSVVVKCFMAHHQGMTFVALANCLLNNIMPRRFHAEPMVRATELLLQERVPDATPLADLPAQETAALATFHEIPPHLSRRITTPHTAHPRTHLLASAKYSLMVTNAGAGFSTARGLDVTRWREDRTSEAFGQFFYLRDLRTGKRWSVPYQPLCQEPDEYEVIFATDKVEFRRVDHGLEIRLEITVSPENHAEVRRLTFTNHGKRSFHLELSSYVEIVLAPHGADLAHPAFGKLFLETEYLPAIHALLCRRRPRSPEQKPIWALHVMAGEGRSFGPAQYETDRARFLGRGRTTANPAALDPGAGPLSGTTGPVLDPIFCLRRPFRVKAGSSVHFAFTTALADSREEAIALADHYKDFHGVHRAFELAWAHTQLELRQLHLTAAETHWFQRLATHLIYAGPALRGASALVASNREGQTDLWRLGISGDLPIVLLRISSAEELPLARQVVTAHVFWRLKGLTADLVILNGQEGSYFEDLQQQLQLMVRASEDRTLVDKPGGVFLRKTSHLAREDQLLLQASARCILVGSRGLLGTQLDRLERALAASEGRSVPASPLVAPELQAKAVRPPAQTPLPLVFDNGLGGFTKDGQEYVLHLPSQHGSVALPPQPWVNVIANPSFGFLVSESGGGFTWAVNSQTNRLTPWQNDPVSDAPGEVLYLRDESSYEVWSATPMPCGGPVDFTVRHGQGYTLFEHQRDGVAYELSLFVSADAPLKWYRLKISNRNAQPRRLAAFFYAEWVLGTHRDRTAAHTVTEVDTETGALLARNSWEADFKGKVAFLDVNQRPRTLTADRTEFLGRHGSLAAPAACKRDRLSGKVGACLDPCAGLQTSFLLRPQEVKEVVFVLGEASSVEEARQRVRTCQDRAQVQAAWQGTKGFWDKLTTTLTINTPSPALNLLVNRWLPYQVLSCRMWGRSGLYQSGGAYGFRDQLQDSLALVYAFPQETRRHLLRTAARQFVEGDVQHWWHPVSGAGVRTRFSDDYLWLPFAVHHYVLTTGDETLLDEKVAFLQAPVLRPEQEEDYRVPEIAEETATIFEHCVRAIEHGLRFGAHGLPLMGTGDWNDGMNRVGVLGRGESVWTGWFLLTILERFAGLCERRGEGERAHAYRDHAKELHSNLELHAWDGQWYRRAYFDDGKPLGSAENDECRIDSLVQSWAVISGGGNAQRVRQAMAAAEENLVRLQDRLVLLFTPPFDKGELQPGYIKGYVPGIRENGGQYTHAALWVAQAWAMLHEPKRAIEVLELINPILSSDSAEAVQRYRLEPYVLPGDVYGQPPHTGRGGWSWYTGSAAWYYRVVVENLLGFELRGDHFRLQPCLPEHWPQVELTYRFRSATYAITAANARNLPAGGQNTFDGQPWKEEAFPLLDDGKTHTIVIYV